MYNYIYSAYDGQTRWYLKDDDFEEEVQWQDSAAKSIITVYEKRKLPVISNLLKYYTHDYTNENLIMGINRSLNDFNTRYPEIRFKEKYYPCLINQAKRLIFIGK